MIRRSAVTDISPKAILVGVLVGTLSRIAYTLATMGPDGVWDGEDLWMFVLWVPATLLFHLATGGVVGALAAVFYCSLRKPRNVRI
jgi:hypothetical protein